MTYTYVIVCNIIKHACICQRIPQRKQVHFATRGNRIIYIYIYIYIQNYYRYLHMYKYNLVYTHNKLYVNTYFVFVFLFPRRAPVSRRCVSCLPPTAHMKYKRVGKTLAVVRLTIFCHTLRLTLK